MNEKKIPEKKMRLSYKELAIYISWALFWTIIHPIPQSMPIWTGNWLALFSSIVLAIILAAIINGALLSFLTTNL